MKKLGEFCLKRKLPESGCLVELKNTCQFLALPSREVENCRLLIVFEWSGVLVSTYSCLSTSESLWTGNQAITLTLTQARPSYYY